MLAQEDPQEVSPYFSKQWRIGVNNQALSNGSDASRGEAEHPFDLHHTKATGARGGKLGVVTKRGNIDVSLLGCLQYTPTFLCLDLQAIDLELNFPVHKNRLTN